MSKKQKSSKYAFRPGARVAAGLSAQAVGEWMKALREKHGGALTPKIIVDSAAIPTSPAHRQFEWNDQVCGTAHRLWQARMLMRDVEIIEIVHEPTGPREVQVPDLVHAPSSGTYKQITDMTPEEIPAAIAEIRGKMDGMERLLYRLELQLGKLDFNDKAQLVNVALEGLANCRLALSKVA